MADQERGVINLPGVFAAAADDLLSAVKRGRILHSTNNIRDSGAPFEAGFRAWLAQLLPRCFVVHQGYLFDILSNCSPQIDIIIAEADRSQVMLRSPEGATYSPFTDAYAVAEVKASGNDIKNSLEQFTRQLDSIAKMRMSLEQSGQTRLARPISLLVVGEADQCNETHIQQHWEKIGEGFPDFILLLSEGELIMPEDFFSGLSGPVGELAPTERPMGRHLAVYSKGDDKAEKRGNALLWLFYSLAHRLRTAQARNMQAALNEIGGRPADVQSAARILSPAADPFASAVMSEFRLSLVRSLK